MNKELDNLKFSTKSIMLTDKQRNTISDLIDQLNDMDCEDYNDIEYWKLSKQDAAKLISEMLDKIDEIDYINEADYYDYPYDIGDR